MTSPDPHCARSRRTGLVLVIAVLGFALGPACFYGRPDTNPPPPAEPRRPLTEAGGQRLFVRPPVDAAVQAERALTALGWTVVASEREGELFGRLHANQAVIRWDRTGWWVRVDQRADFATGRAVPPWDHPWEALRLLHLCAPGTGPAEGWNTWQGPEPMPAATDVGEVVQVLAALQAEAAGDAAAGPEREQVERARRWLARHRLDTALLLAYLRAGLRQPTWSRTTIEFLTNDDLAEHGKPHPVLEHASRTRQDPFTVHPPTERFGGALQSPHGYHRPYHRPPGSAWEHRQALLTVAQLVIAFRQPEENIYFTSEHQPALALLTSAGVEPPGAPIVVLDQAQRRAWFEGQVRPLLDAIANGEAAPEGQPLILEDDTEEPTP